MTTPRGVARMRAARTNPWLRFLLRRGLSLVAVVAVLVVASFMLVRLIPGDPALVVAGPDASAAQIEQIRRALGLDAPPLEQFTTYVTRVVRGDFGSSFITREPVGRMIGQRIGTSLQLAGAALALVLLVAIPLGMLAGALTREGRHRRGEVAFTAVTSVVGSLPEYLAATFLAFVFAVWLRILPVAGTEGWQSLVLPTLAISARPMAILARIVRVETLNVLAQDFIRTARSKRLPERLIYSRHVLPNVVTAALTIGGILFAAIVGGGVIIENVFSRAGLGTALVSAVLSRDYPVIQGVILVLGITVVVVNAIVDILLGLLDPRSLARQA
jgi:peptide/nickel transport system permease protein